MKSFFLTVTGKLLHCNDKVTLSPGLLIPGAGLPIKIN